MLIEQGTVVTVHYKLQKENAEGELVEQTHGAEPLVFLYGVGQMIPEFERQLEGKEKGDKLQFGVEHLHAYGPYNEEVVVPIPVAAFVVDGKLAEDLLVPGNVIPMSDQSGQRMYGEVKEIKDEQVIMDFNHPMAGIDLFFSVDIEEVRAATESEMEHGHVHGPGGHQH